MLRSTGGRAMPLASFGRLDLAATSSAIFLVSSASLLGGISLSTSRHSLRALAAHALGGGAEEVGVVAPHHALVDQPRQPAGAGQHGEQRQLGQRHRARAVVGQQDLVAGQRQLVAAAGGDAVDRADVALAGMLGRVLDGRAASRW